MSGPPVALEIRDGVAHVMRDRPDRGNPFEVAARRSPRFQGR